MNVEIIATAAATVVTVGTAGTRVLGRMTLNARAEGQLRQVELLRRAGIADEARYHDRQAKVFLLRPAVMQERGIIGPIGFADLAAYGLLLGAGVVALWADLALPGVIMAFGLTLGAVALIILDSAAVDRACKTKAAAYDDRRLSRSSSRLRPCLALSALLGVALLTFRR